MTIPHDLNRPDKGLSADEVDGIAKETLVGGATGAAAGAATGGIVSAVVGNFGIAALGTAIGVGAWPVIAGSAIVGATAVGAGSLMTAIRKRRKGQAKED